MLIYLSRVRRPFFGLVVFCLFLTLITLIGSVGISKASDTITYAVRLSPESLAEVAGLEPIHTLDYDTYVWLELGQDDFARLQAANVPYQVQANAYTLRLGEISFDPQDSSPALPAGWDAVSNSGPDLHLVQFIGPTKAEWLESLAGNNLEVVQYIHPFTYVVWGENVEDVVTSDNLLNPVVRWTGPFAPAYRVQPQWRNLNSQPVEVDILMYRGAGTDSAVRSILDLEIEGRGQAVLNNTWEIAGFTMPGSLFQTVAQIPGVYSIQPVPTDGGPRGEMSNQINVNNHDGSNQAFPGYQAWLTAAGVDGSGVTIANVDGGVQETHPDLVNRMVSCTGTTCSGASSQHGTHTAGIMAADGASGIVDSFGFLRGQGMAPGANLFEQVYSPWFQQPGGMLLLMTDSYNNGGSLSGNSWGPSGSPLGYDNHTMQVDIGVRDADPVAAGNQPLTFVLSFMNGGGGTSTQGTPDEGKNLFNIGSTKMQTGSGSQILDINDISSNSAHGPALDGRTIPHMVAPGCSVDSSVSGSGYGLLCGTSMASPHVSGAVALFIEYYRNLPLALRSGPADPSPALIKAAFLPVAHDLAGHLDADGGTLGHPFDSKQGWGRMDTAAVVSPTMSIRYFDNPVIFDNTGEEWTQTFSPADPSLPIRLMLVWTDAPGHGLGGSTPAWNNDLDLVAEVGGDTYYGNNFNAGGWSQTGGTADNKNNTEGIFLGPTAPGSVTVRVVAANINSDGIPNQGDTTDQDFAIVCYNCALEPDFALSVNPAALQVCTPANAVYNITINQILGYSDSVTLSAVGNPAGTTANFSNNPVTPPDTSILTIGNTGAASAGSYGIDIVGVATTRTHTTTVGLQLFTTTPGTVNLTLPADGATDLPVTPDFSWTAASQGHDYTLEVAEDLAFTNIVYSAVLDTTSHTAETALEPDTTYYWRVRAGNACGSGSNSAVFDFTTAPIPPILLVDDDDNSPDVRGTYTAALDALGLEYDIWDTANSDNEPALNFLAPYQAIIWFTGDEFGGAAGPGSASETTLGNWLDNGNCLFLSSQDYLYDRLFPSTTPNAFMSNYLGIGSLSHDSGDYNSVTGMGSVFGGLGPYPLSYPPLSDFSDRVSPTGSAELAFDGNNGNDAAINKDNGTYKSTFLGYPWEAISSAANREAVLETFINWCGIGQATGTLEGQVTDADSSQPISGATVTADDGDNIESTTTDGNGDYDLALPPGAYDVTVTANGYFSQTVSNINVLTDTVTTQDFALTAAIGTLERSENTIEETMMMGQSVTRTLWVSNTGNVAFNFTVSEGAAWAEVTPSGGTLDPGETMALSVVFDSSATAGAGTYNDALSFSGSYDNSPADVSLILHVTEESSFTTYLPMVVGNGGAAATPPANPTAALPWLLPLFGLVMGGTGWLTTRLHRSTQRS